MNFMGVKNVVCYSNSLNGQDPMAHLRIIGPFREAGIDVLNGIENGKAISQRVSGGEIVLIQREFPNRYIDFQQIVETARNERKPVVFDLDDLLFFLPEDHPDRQSQYYAASLLPMFQALTEADLVTVSTPKLMEVLVQYNDQIAVLPNYLDDTLWRLRSPVSKQEGEILTIGYMGGESHKPDLEPVVPILSELVQRYPNKIRLQFWGIQPPTEMRFLPQVGYTPLASYNYKEFSVFFQTQSADIFIAPLADSLFNRCKSQLKFFEYTALGSPGVYSNLETYSKIVTHGQNGLLAASLDEWRECLIQLIENDDLRLHLAENAQLSIRTDWLLSQNAFRWKDAYNNLLEGAPRQTPSQEKVVQSINIQLAEKEQAVSAHLAGLEDQIVEKEQVLRASRELIASQDTQLVEKEQAAQALSRQLSEKETTILSLIAQTTEKDQSVKSLSAEIAEINRSRAWKLALVFRRIRVLLAPPGSRRTRIFGRLIKGVFVRLNKIKRDQEVKKDSNLIRASGLFDEEWYLTKYPDIAEAKVDPLLHYLNYGGLEGRDPGPTFNSSAYLYDNPYVRRAGINPLVHYLKYGKNEERVPAAHAVISGSMDVEYIPISEIDVDPKTLETKLIAFYLPQFHPIPENDEWWGKGFTEWTNVSKAIPNFKGHYQPRLPGELGFYDLRVPEVQKRQIELARKYGIYGFCFHYYWFNGRRLLERPLNQFLEDPDLVFPFCLCWANENWTRRWDGLENDILIEQVHSEEEYLNFIRDIIPIFLDNRYIRVDGKPLLIVYRISLLPNPRLAADIWRSECKKMGIGDIYLVAAQSFGITDPRPYGFDAAVEFPPHNLWPTQIPREMVQVINPKFTGRLFDYRKAVQQMMGLDVPKYPLFRTVMPAWDNTARKQNDGYAFINSTPLAYKTWLEYTINYTKRVLPEDKQFVFINSWNEWGEGAYLEPDRLYGYAYLQATAEAITTQPRKAFLSKPHWTILFVSHDAIKGGAQAVLLNTILWFREHTSIRLKVLCLHGGEWLPRFKELADTIVLSELQNSADGKTDSGLVNDLMDFCGGTIDLIYGNTVAAGREYKWLSKPGIPILTHVHELETSIKHYAGEWIDDVIKYSAHFVAGSRAIADNLIENHGVSTESISLGYASIVPTIPFSSLGQKEKTKLKKKLGLAQDKILIFGCGLGMPFRKGADLFIELGRILQREGIDNFHLYWIGDFEEPYYDQDYGNWSDYLDRLQRSKLNSRVTFLGSKENPREYLRVGDMFVLTSREEPFGLVALEAADCELPTICFNNAGVADFVEDGAGFVVPDEDVEAMARKLIELIKDNNLSQALGNRAREKLLTSFTAERTTPKILSICRQVGKQKPGVSVVVPNYNHAQYLPQRLDSIFSQTYQDFEVILLDDASSDSSMDVLEKYSGRGDVQLLRNEHNSGTPFKQWIKGIDLARSEILWIAESDDVCDPEFLRYLLPAFDDPEVRLAYANSHIIDEKGTVLGDYLDSPYLVSLSPTKWQTNYKVSAEQEINDGLGVKDTILNASAVLYRKFELDNDFRSVFSEMQIAGDWFFIVNEIRDGTIQYDSRKLNYHRRHSESVIGKVLQDKKLERFFEEFCLVQRYVFTHYKLTPEFLTKWEEYLRQQWNEFFPNRSFDEINVYYPFDEMKTMIIDSITRVSENQLG
jgi:glycosyltransferase involved in cell wall biosynthesis